MTAQEERLAFARGIARACSERGAGELAEPLFKFSECAGSFELDPEAFAEGFSRLVKRAYDEYGERKSFLRRILPWILVPAGILGAAGLGSMWGRHAQATGNPDGPIKGPFKKLIEGITGQKFTHVGKEGAMAVLDDWRNKPMSASQLENLSRTGTVNDPKVFG